MKKFSLSMCLVSALLLVGGCHPITVKTGFDPGANFAGRKTYGWQPGAKLDTGNPRFDTPEFEAELRRTVDATLSGKGFRSSDSDHPDFLVGYTSKTKSASSTVTRERTFSTTGQDWQWTGSNTAHYEVGSLVLEMTEPGTSRLLWRAVASAVVIDRASAAERQERIGKAVRKMLDDFPPP